MAQAEEQVSPKAGPLEAAGATTGASRKADAISSRGAVRQGVEFLVGLSLSILLFRTFGAEAYVVPTGSMAPTLLGMHQELICPSCGIRFSLGMDEEGRTGRGVCPNCGQTDVDPAAGATRNGDRLLVQKFFFDFRPPRRWEVAVFHSPVEPNQAYVKRVVGLPNESILLSRGNVFVNGRIARKSLPEQRGMRILVFDNDYRPLDSERYPRWEFRRRPLRGGFGWRGEWARSSRWKIEGARFVHSPGERAQDERLADWIDYKHWDPERGYGPVLDFCPYNGLGPYHSENAVGDLTLEAQVAPGPDTSAVLVRIAGVADRFVVSIPVDGRSSLKVHRNGSTVPVKELGGKLASSAVERPRFVKLEASLVDQRLTVALDGELLFEPYDYDDPSVGTGPGARYSGPSASQLGMGVVGGAAVIDHVRIFRDVYYTTVLANSPRRPYGVDTPYQLGPHEYFVLGDNSPVSNDSRFWPVGPVVRSELLLGKPFLVHLPSQGFPLKVFGRELYWIPDPREIRYIR